MTVWWALGKEVKLQLQRFDVKKNHQRDSHMELNFKEFNQWQDVEYDDNYSICSACLSTGLVVKSHSYLFKVWFLFFPQCKH